MRVGLVCLVIALVVLYSTRSSAQSPDPQVVSVEVRVNLVGRAYTRELEELLREWFAAQGQSVSIGRQPSVALEHLLQAGDENEVRVWLVLPNDRRARLYFADTGSQRFFVRDVPLDSGLDELGREKLAQVVVASVQAFAERRVEDTPLESVKQALAESPGSEQPQAASSPNSGPSPEAASPSAPNPTRAVSAAGANEVRAGEGRRDVAKSLSWALAAGYQASYRGAEGLAHGPRASLEGWLRAQSVAFALVARGRYELPHTVSAEDLDVRFQTTALRLGGLAATLSDGKPAWVIGVTMGFDWFEFRPTRGFNGVVLREAGNARRPMASVAAGRYLFIGALRMGLFAGVDVALAKSHYDVLVVGEPRRELTPWQAQPNLSFEIAWH